ncbi:MAG: hypothetical protein DCC71_00980 [Proteobacteria bacterium]|nr:MAG: hypothetical protein DCC71_00980 [Pseudomonadota bacterium]
MHSAAREFVREMLEMTAGPLVWLLYLLVMYGAAAVHCARPAADAADRTPLLIAGGALGAVAIGLLAWSVLRARRELASESTSDARRFVDRVAFALGVFGIGAIVWTALPVLLSPACGVVTDAAQRSW